MLKRITAVFFGFITGFILVSLIQMISAKMYPPPPDLLPQDQEAMQAYFSTLPTGARIISLIAHIMGAFGAAFIAAKRADKYKLYLGLLVGVVIMVASASFNFASYAPPYIILIDFILTGLAAWLGARTGL